MNNKLDIQTTLQKRSLRLPKLYRLFDYIFRHYGKWDNLNDSNSKNDNIRPYTLEFIDNSIVNEITQAEVIDRQLSNDTTTNIQAIKDQHKITNKKAKLMYEERLKEKKELGKLEMNYFDDDKQTREEDIKGNIQ